jgi:hypothetical protein
VCVTSSLLDGDLAGNACTGATRVLLLPCGKTRVAFHAR